MAKDKYTLRMEIKNEKEILEYNSESFRKSKKRKFEHEDSDSEQRRLTANSQERIRMQKINSALEELKKCLPEQFHLHHRRMSKIRALRCAMVYIRNLSQLIHEDNLRRQEHYMHAMNYMRSVYDPRFSGMSPDVGDVNEMQASAIPYYPYLGQLCADSVASVYQTPVQNPPTQIYQPRPLDFSMATQTEIPNREVSSSNTDHEAVLFIDGITETPVKPKHHALPRPRRYSVSATPISSRIFKTKTETITSPLVGLRNDNELNISFLSANSDNARDEHDETQRPSSTLSDIVIGPC